MSSPWHGPVRGFASDGEVEQGNNVLLQKHGDFASAIGLRSNGGLSEFVLQTDSADSLLVAGQGVGKELDLDGGLEPGLRVAASRAVAWSVRA
ncbi:hypothetical protein PCANC_17283 [Puccinia coronata f. sp. avenae]|uniref:Uncharacterized protein n=1 Tax=Puccinia coronata f. sp. avenae TaxID=200324 RepID=A0A2N5UID0_9BASI|nr:hypothetical protein PCANC_17283 [Puccinia coronata f. sp. avenae]